MGKHHAPCSWANPVCYPKWVSSSPVRLNKLAMPVHSYSVCVACLLLVEHSSCVHPWACGDVILVLQQNFCCHHVLEQQLMLFCGWSVAGRWQHPVRCPARARQEMRTHAAFVAAFTEPVVHVAAAYSTGETAKLITHKLALRHNVHT